MSFSYQIRILGLVFLSAAIGFLSWKQLKKSTDSGKEDVELARIEEKPVAKVNRWESLADDSLPLEKRIKLAQQIRLGIPDDEVKYLFSILSRTARVGGEQDWWVVMNEVMGQMVEHGVGSKEYPDRLVELVGDTQQNIVVRDYAIQYMRRWVAPMVLENTPTDEVKRQKVLTKIVEVIRNPASQGTSLPGTGLMALVDISPRLDEQTSTRIWSDLESYLQEVIPGKADVALSTRISAVQAVAIRGEGAYLPIIRQLAADESADASMRLSAIAALGIYADPEDRAFLESLVKSGTRFQYAAKSALARSAVK